VNSLVTLAHCCNYSLCTVTIIREAREKKEGMNRGICEPKGQDKGVDIGGCPSQLHLHP